MMIRDMQKSVARWHRRNYPGTSPTDVALKLAEETGEVCRAVVERQHPSLHRPSTTSLSDELGDVVIAVMALANLAGIDLQSAAAHRWATVSQRNRNA